MPKLLAKEVNDEMLAVTVEEAIQQHVEDAEHNAPIRSPTQQSLPKTVFYDMGVQTDVLPL